MTSYSSFFDAPTSIQKKWQIGCPTKRSESPVFLGTSHFPEIWTQNANFLSNLSFHARNSGKLAAPTGFESPYMTTVSSTVTIICTLQAKNTITSASYMTIAVTNQLGNNSFGSNAGGLSPVDKSLTYCITL